MAGKEVGREWERSPPYFLLSHFFPKPFGKEVSSVFISEVTSFLNNILLHKYFLNGQNPSVFIGPFTLWWERRKKGKEDFFRNLPKTVWLVVYVCR